MKPLDREKISLRSQFLPLYMVLIIAGGCFDHIDHEEMPEEVVTVTWSTYMNDSDTDATPEATETSEEVPRAANESPLVEDQVVFDAGVPNDPDLYDSGVTKDSGITIDYEDDMPIEEPSLTEGIWVDESTGLLWEEEMSSTYRNFESSKAYCQGLIIGEFTEWRLPTIGELRSIIHGCKCAQNFGKCLVSDMCTNKESCWSFECVGCPSIDGCFQPDELQGECLAYQWSSSEGENDSYWAIKFSQAALIELPGRLGGAVRCVHG